MRPSAGKPTPNEVQLTQRVLADLQRQVELMLEVRLREALAPLLARATDTLVRDARKELTAAMRDIVAKAIAKELGRHDELIRREGRYASLWASWTAAQARAS